MTKIKNKNFFLIIFLFFQIILIHNLSKIANLIQAYKVGEFNKLFKRGKTNVTNSKIHLSIFYSTIYKHFNKALIS